MIIKYYKSTSAYRAFADFEQRFEEHFESCRQFAARFNAQPVVMTDPNSVTLAGVILNDWPNRADADLWQKPDQKRGGHQVPRTGRGIPKDRREEAEQLAKEWKRDRPGRLERAGVWESLGLTWGDLFLAGMNHHLEHASETLWIATSLSLSAEHATEVMASEYESAVAALNAENEKGES